MSVTLCYHPFSFGSKHVTPRSLSARHLGNLVCCEGIVTKCKWLLFPSLPPSQPHPLTGSLVRPKVVKSVHYCPATRKTIERKYTDLTSLDPFPTSGVYPTRVRGQAGYNVAATLLSTCMDVGGALPLPRPLR